MLTATAHIVVFLAGLLSAAALRHGAPYITPFAPADQVQRFFSQAPFAMRVANFFVFGSAVPLGIFAATVVSRLRFYGVRATGTSIALFGGGMAALALFLSGITGWTLSLHDVTASAALAKAIYYLSFLSGGAMYAVAFGLLAAGVSVTSYFTRLLPPWLAALGMFTALTGELSSLSLVTFPANFFIPVTRYIGFLWMLLVAATLSSDRRLVAARPNGPSA